MSSADLSVFRHEGVDIRVQIIDGEPMWVAADVARALEFRSAPDMTRSLDDDEKGYADVRTPGGIQRMTMITEAGVYQAIFGSRAKRVHDFKRWITHDVLPAIRRTGGYTHDVERALPQSYGEALRMLADEVEQRAALEAKVEADAPKVEYVDEYVHSDDVILLRVAANEIGMGEHELRDALVAARWIYRTLIGTRWSVSKGREVREYEYRASAAHADKFVSKQQHNAPRHHNGQVRTTLYVRVHALPDLRRRFAIKAVTA
jgi:prophage antirepressor-like protein